MKNVFSLIFYFFVFAVVIIACYKQSRYLEKNKESKYLRVVIIGIPAVIAGIRYGVGGDYFRYLVSSTRYMEYSLLDYLASGNFEVGYFVVCKIGGMSGNPYLSFGIMSFIMMHFLYKGLVYHADKVSMPFAMMVYMFVWFPQSFNLVRQATAIAIVFYAYRYILEVNAKKYFLFILLAVSMHSSAIVMFPIYFIHQNKSYVRINEKWKFNYIKICMYLVIVIFVFYFQTIVALFSQISFLADYSSYSIEKSNANNREMYLNLIILASTILFRKSLIKYDKKMNCTFPSLLWGFCLDLWEILIHMRSEL